MSLAISTGQCSRYHQQFLGIGESWWKIFLRMRLLLFFRKCKSSWYACGTRMYWHCSVIYYQGWKPAKGKMFCDYLTMCHHRLLRHMDANLNAYGRTRNSCSFTLWIKEKPEFSRSVQHHSVLLIIKHEDKQFIEWKCSQESGLVLIGQKQLSGKASWDMLEMYYIIPDWISLDF